MVLSPIGVGGQRRDDRCLEPGEAVVYWILKYILLGPILKLLFRPWVEGIENVPKEGPIIIAANHLSFIDSLLVPLMVPRRLVYLGKADYFGKWYSAFFTSVNVIPVDRSGGEASMAALNAGIKELKKGHAVGIYPEGTRSPDGRLYRGKTGVARMAVAANALIVPVALIGTFEAQPADKKIPRPRKIGIRFGAPIDVSRYEGKEDDRFVLRSITDELMYEIMMLSGQEYVDEYASKFKKRQGAPPAPAAEREPVAAG
jgi:1-acyl-sn-glycerol-3-phosphate acyltransferase